MSPSCLVKQINCRGMEQSVARRAHNPKVVGSSPTPATIKNAFMRKRFLLARRALMKHERSEYNPKVVGNSASLREYACGALTKSYSRNQ